MVNIAVFIVFIFVDVGPENMIPSEFYLCSALELISHLITISCTQDGRRNELRKALSLHRRQNPTLCGTLSLALRLSSFNLGRIGCVIVSFPILRGVVRITHCIHVTTKYPLEIYPKAAFSREFTVYSRLKNWNRE